MSWTYSGINDHLKSHNLSMAEYEMKYHVMEGQEDTAQVRYRTSRTLHSLVKALVELVRTSVLDPDPGGQK